MVNKVVNFPLRSTTRRTGIASLFPHNIISLETQTRQICIYMCIKFIYVTINRIAIVYLEPALAPQLLPLPRNRVIATCNLHVFPPRLIRFDCFAHFNYPRTNANFCKQTAALLQLPTKSRTLRRPAHYMHNVNITFLIYVYTYSISLYEDFYKNMWNNPTTLPIHPLPIILTSLSFFKLI